MARRRTPEGDQPSIRPGEIYPRFWIDEETLRPSQEYMNNMVRSRREAEERRMQEMDRERLMRHSRLSMTEGYGPRGPRFEARFQFDMDELMRSSHQAIVHTTVEAISKEVVRLASEKIANKFVDQLAERMERELLIGVKELSDELSRSMEERGAKDDGLPQRIEGHEGFPRIT